MKSRRGMKRTHAMEHACIIIVHGWGASPKSDWLAWLKKELERKGASVIVPAMPRTNHPIIKAWVSHLESVIRKAGSAHKDLILVGHSIGCQAILRTLEKSPSPSALRIKGVALVAPWFTLKNLEGPGEEAIAKPWLATPIDLAKAMYRIGKLTAFFSTNDPLVPFPENKKRFGAAFQAIHPRIIVMKGKGHFNALDGVREFPALLAELTRITRMDE